MQNLPPWDPGGSVIVAAHSPEPAAGVKRGCPARAPRPRPHIGGPAAAFAPPAEQLWTSILGLTEAGKTGVPP